MDKIAIVVMSISTVVAAILGVLLTVWFKRSKPWLGLTSIARDDRYLVSVSEDVRALANNSPWVKGLLSEHTPLQKLMKVHDDTRWGISHCKESLQNIELFEKSLKEGLATETEKRNVLLAFLKDDIIVQVLSGITRRGLLPLPDHIDIDPSATPLLLGDDLTKPEIEDKGFLLYAQDERVFFRAGTGIVGAEILKRFKVLGEVFQYFLDKYIYIVTENLKGHIQKDMQCLLEIRERLGDTMKSQKLVVRAQVANVGGRPEHIEPFGILKLNSGGKPVPPVLVEVSDYRVYEAGMEDFPKVIELVEGMAEKQGVEAARMSRGDRASREYIIVKPGDIVQVELSTLAPIEDTSVLDALEAGMLSCRLVLKRANRRIGKWLISDSIILGDSLNQDRKRELIEVGSR